MILKPKQKIQIIIFLTFFTKDNDKIYSFLFEV